MESGTGRVDVVVVASWNVCVPIRTLVVLLVPHSFLSPNSTFIYFLLRSIDY